MSVKVTRTKNWKSDGVTTSSIDFLSDVKAPKRIKNKIRKDVGDFLIEETLDALGSSKNMLTGKKSFAKLSKEYKAKKEKAGRGGSPNLEFDGDMVSSLRYKQTENGIELGLFKSKEAAKADGHNNFSGQSRLPTRQFLPNESRGYDKSTKNSINEIILNAIGTETKIPQELADIDSIKDFWAVLKNTFAGLSKSEIKIAVLADPDWINFLEENDLLEFL